MVAMSQILCKSLNLISENICTYSFGCELFMLNDLFTFADLFMNRKISTGEIRHVQLIVMKIMSYFGFEINQNRSTSTI